jgi:hypothetical protein
VLFRECILMILLFIAISFALYGLLYLFFKERTKAALLTFLLIAFDLFFGSIYDFILYNFGRIFLLKYKVIVPAAFIVILLIIIALKRSSKKLHRAILFLNLLFLLFTVWEFVVFAGKAARYQPIYTENLQAQLQPCDSCSKPDIYLIVADEYAGNQELKDLFSFDNSRFEQELKNRGFHVNRSTFSNYNSTAYSMASMLNMGYLSPIKNNIMTHATILESQELIRNNKLTPFLEESGYRVLNHSIFELHRQKNLISDPFYASRSQIFLAQTFLKRVVRDISFNFSSSQKIETTIRHEQYNNNTVLQALLNTIPSRSPKFVYAHFTLPHHPYNYDSSGRKISSDSLNPGYKYNKPLYLSYLKYSNTYFLQIIDSIRTHSKKPPIILLISDHGFRQFDKPVDKQYYFMTLNAVYLPARNYTGFYDGMSNVNLFRVILSSQFRQPLPTLRDSSIFLIRPKSTF